jgi:glycosyltransferase involved in cell wall biosynthesis
VLVEVMVCGSSVVAVECPSGPSEILEGWLFGSVMRTCNPAELAQAILRTSEAPFLADVLQEGRSKDYTAGCVADKYLSALLGDASE